MAKNVVGEHEIKKFWNDLSNYQMIGEHAARDWGSMAEDWNKFVAEREKSNGNNVIKYYRKHPHMLEAFFLSGGKNLNIKATLQPHLSSIESLMREHRNPVDAPITAVSAPCPPATHGPNSSDVDNRDLRNMVPVVPLQMSSTSTLTSQISGPLLIPGQIEQSVANNSLKKRTLERAPQLCSLCGHYRLHNKTHNDKHNGICTVPKELYSSDTSLNSWCPCLECTIGAESVGYSKPIFNEKEKRSWKTCIKCGHYKDYGSYQDKHLNNRCDVPEETEVNNRIRYHGYCACESCMAAAALEGQEKPGKLRKAYKKNINT